MKIILTGEQTHNTGFISDNCFYVVPQPDGCVLCSTFREAVEYIAPQNRVLDPVALLSLLLFGYICGDRTLVKGLTRLPLHATVNSRGEILRHSQLPHGHRRAPASEIAARLQELLTEEIEAVVRTEPVVAILLSGGLDSRVTAGILRRLQIRYGFQVQAVTWGSMQARDWVFADRICTLYDWEHLNIPITSETLWANTLYCVGEVGAEVAGGHLHGIRELSRLLPRNTLVLASTYGDGIGRAAYSGVHVSNLYYEKPHNPFGLYYEAWYRRCRQALSDDIRAPWSRGETCTRQQGYEIACQENYLRRMLNPLMHCMDSDLRLYQVFTAEPLVRIMWSFDPFVRDDRVYENLLPSLDRELARIPWQKTNRALVEDAWSPGVELARRSYDYPAWIRDQLCDRLESRLFGNLGDLTYVNYRHMRFRWTQFQAMDADHPSFREFSWHVVQLAGVLKLMADYGITCESASLGTTLYDRTVLPLWATDRMRQWQHRLKSAPRVGARLSGIARKSRSLLIR